MRATSWATTPCTSSTTRAQSTDTAGYCILARCFDPRPNGEQLSRPVNRIEYQFIDDHWPEHLPDYPQRLPLSGRLRTGPSPSRAVTASTGWYER